MASNLVVSEFLSFTLNKVGKSPAKNVKAVLLDFYNEDEIWSAKALLRGELSKLTSDELPRLVHRKGDNKARRDVDDLFTLLARVDKLNVHSFQPLLQLFQTKCHIYDTRGLGYVHCNEQSHATRVIGNVSRFCD